MNQFKNLEISYTLIIHFYLQASRCKKYDKNKQMWTEKREKKKIKIKVNVNKNRNRNINKTM